MNTRNTEQMRNTIYSDVVYNIQKAISIRLSNITRYPTSVVSSAEESRSTFKESLINQINVSIYPIPIGLSQHDRVLALHLQHAHRSPTISLMPIPVVVGTQTTEAWAQSAAKELAGSFNILNQEINLQSDRINTYISNYRIHNKTYQEWHTYTKKKYKILAWIGTSSLYAIEIGSGAVCIYWTVSNIHYLASLNQILLHELINAPINPIERSAIWTGMSEIGGQLAGRIVGMALICVIIGTALSTSWLVFNIIEDRGEKENNAMKRKIMTDYLTQHLQQPIETPTTTQGITDVTIPDIRDIREAHPDRLAKDATIIVNYLANSWAELIRQHHPQQQIQ